MKLLDTRFGESPNRRVASAALSLLLHAGVFAFLLAAPKAAMDLRVWAGGLLGPVVDRGEEVVRYVSIEPPGLATSGGDAPVRAEPEGGIRAPVLQPDTGSGGGAGAPGRPEGPGAAPGALEVGGPGGGGRGGGTTAAERLRPRLQDARLWAPLSRDINELTTEQRLELELAGRIVDWQDSLAVAAEMERALTDWTTTDAQGKRWGVSPGKIHLGDVTLPLPFMFGTPVGRRDEVNRRAWEWEEISRGAATGEVRDSWKDRAQAIRERRDRDRAKPPPDTTRVRR
ncbi:MAG: hypothetical protein Q8N53_19500 [Longimicrobiales bacterium]|nr:hypothetical protein [Longimicrobiales bacterium]